MALAEQHVIVPELLDHASPEEARPVLADLARVNRYFGGHLILRKIMSGLAERGESFSMLDVGGAHQQHRRGTSKPVSAPRPWSRWID